MKRTFMTVVCALLGGACLAADPGGLPGLVKAKFTGSAFNSTGDVYANALGYTDYPTEMYATSCPEKTTYAWAGYMKLEGGVSYDFKGCYDDYVTVKIAGTWVLSQGSECVARTGMYKPTATDWYAVEFRVGNNGGGGGIQNSSQYGILWKKTSETDWHQVEELDGGKVFKTGQTGLKSLTGTMPRIISSQVRANDPTVLDVVYKVLSGEPTVKVRALAFEDGTRSFYNVIRPETFVNDPQGNPTAQNIGDAIAPNVEHKLAWKVSSDWKVDLAKCKFEILVSEQGQLPMDLITIPATAKNGSFVVSYGSQTSADVFNAMLWYYAAHEKDLVLDDGYLSATNSAIVADGVRMVNRTALNYNLNVIEYIYDKMGYGLLNGALQEYARKATRKALTPGGVTIYGYKREGAPASVYVGEKAYCVIDVSAGANAASYPVTYLDSAPTAGWGDEYKTTKILLRRIEPGTFNMSGRTTTLTKPYYMGVFQVTQKQYQLVAGGNPSQYKGDMRPVEYVSWNTIRGDSGTYNWPSVTTVNANTFVGRLQARTGLSFDLPTEAQWEYACRSGTTGNYNNGNECSLLGRYNDTQGDMRGGYGQHTTVGSYLSNGWGLYDMHGNVFEWCLDWYGSIDTLAAADDPTGAASGSCRVQRGGVWDYYYDLCYSSFRGYSYPSGSYDYYGFRLSRTLANEE